MLAVWCCAVPGHAHADVRGPAGIAAGQPLRVARSRLVKAGWTPRRMPVRAVGEYFGAERALLRAGVFEFEACSSDSSRCILHYEKRGACLRVDTIGEQVRDMNVTGWSEQCPDAPPG